MDKASELHQISLRLRLLTEGVISDMLRMEAALCLIAAPMRPDGTFNRDREACRQLAQDVLDGK